MSKAVSGVGNAIGGVLKGAVNLVKDVGNGIGKIVKDIGSSQIGKAILIAGAVYFGGAALAGGYGSAAGGGSFFTGMGAGVSSAATSLSSAWTSAMAGNFAEAGSTIGSSWTGAANAGAATNPGWMAAQANAVSLAEPAASSTSSALSREEQIKYLDSIGAESGEYVNVSAEQAEQIRNATGYNPDLPANAQQHLLNSPTDQVARFTDAQLSPLEQTSQYSLNGPGVSNPGLNLSNSGVGFNAGGSSIPYSPPGSGVMSSIWNSPYTAPALISGGMQVGGAYIQGQAQEKQLREQREYEARMVEEARNRYNSNVGAELWDPNAQAPIYQAQGPAWDPYAEARARAAQRYAPAPVAAPAPTGLAAKYMTA